MSASPARHRLALAIALAGVAASVFTLVIHERIAGGGYTSFCNLGGVVDCDAVLGSRWATFFGIPVAAVSIGAFALGALLALPGALGAQAGLADLGLLGLASGSLGVALVLLAVAAFVLHHLCLLCLTLDAIIIAWVVTVLPLARRFEAAPRGRWWRRSAAHAVVATGLVLAVAGGTVAVMQTPAPVQTLAELRGRDPKFYSWYTQLPVRPMPELLAGSEHAKGPAGAAVTIVEFSDFQCPHCAEAFPDLQKLVRSRPDVRLVFRHFPLDPACNARVSHALHPDACLAAIAAECAGRQDRFWEYHDTLFENQEHLERESLFRYARELGLDIPTFRTCLDDPAVKARVGADVEAGERAGINSTPTLFFNGRTVEGALQPVYYGYALIIETHDRTARASGG